MADFFNLDIRKASNVDATTLQARITPKLSGNETSYGIPSGGSKMRKIAKLMLEMEVEFGISATFLCALMAWETGWGCNSYAYDHNSFFSYGAFDSNPDGTIKNGGKTIEAGLRNGVSAIYNDFVLGKKRYTLNDFQKKPSYASDAGWSKGIASIWANLQGEVNTGSIIGVNSDNRSQDAYNKLIGRQWDWNIYTIQKGDGLASIATMFKTTVAFLCKWNGITTATILNPGWILRVNPMYTVNDGDTMDEIATDFGTTGTELHTLNPFLAGLTPGKSLRLPDSVIDDEPPTNYDQVNRETPSGASRYAKELPLQPVIGVAPHVEDDEYPAHRSLQNPFAVRIGDVQLFIPPTSIKTSKQGFVDHKHVLRSQNGITTRSGHAKRKIELELYFADTDMINGYRVAGPQGRTYYMDGLRPLIAQFMKNPFLPIRNELLNDRHHVYNVAFQNLTIETDPDFDGVLVAKLTLLECTVEPFVQYPDFYYDSIIMWPLFRWWYQQTLADDADERLSTFWLKPVPDGALRGGIGFKVLDRDLVEDFIGKNNMYALSQAKVPELSSLMTKWDIGGAILQKVTIGISKDLQPIYSDHHEMPAFQDLGGLNKEFILEFLCTNRAELESFVAMAEHLEGMSRDYRQRFVSGYLSVDNELINMAGIYNATIVAMDTQTLDEADEEFVVQLFCQGFDVTQKNNERIMGVNSKMEDIDNIFSFSNDPSILIEDKTNRHIGAIYEAAVEEALNTLELYPDLELPTFDDLNGAIVAINKFRRQYNRKILPVNNIQRPVMSVFVDPDFYFAYPAMENIFDTLPAGAFGQRMVNLLSGQYEDFVMASNELDLGWWLDGQDKDLNGWDKDKFTDLQRNQSNINIKLTNAIYENRAEVGTNWGDAHPVPTGEDMMNLMANDMTVYNKRGRMVRAFPSYVILFVDEGQWLNGKRLWNNYYTYHAIQELSVVKDKQNPVDLAYIKMTNVYGAFDFSTKMSDPRDFMSESKGLLGRVAQLFKNFKLTIDEKIITERTQVIDQIKLKQGARVHIRMGYGATATYMPIAFNGQIASINEGDELELVCQGDGVELTRQISLDIGGDLTNGQSLANEPLDIFRQLLVSRMSDYWFIASEDSGNAFDNISSAFGIEHFGYLESMASDSFGGTLADIAKYIGSKFLADNNTVGVEEYDIMKNIFRGDKWHAATAGEDSKWMIFDGELNIGLNPYGRTSWDIMQTVTLHTPEFVCGVHPHGFRSTLFHGMPHWPVKYGYRRKKTEDGKPIGKSTELSSYYEVYKTFQQFHVLASGYDIIHNDIQASSEMIKHIGVGVYTKSRSADTKTTFPVYADRTIKQEIQKTMLVDTMVHQNLFGPEFVYDWTRSIFGFVNDLAAWAGKAGGKAGLKAGLKDVNLSAADQAYYTRMIEEQVDADIGSDRMYQPGLEQALAITIGTLQRQMMEMYQGELIVLGNAALKPWDIFFLSDSYNLMNGTAGVGKVTHSLSLQTGFTTVIKPDLLTTRVDGVQRNEMISNITRAGTYTAGVLGRYVAMSKAAKMIAKVTGGGTLWTVKKAGQAGLFVSKLTAGENAVRLASQAVGKTGEVLKGLSSLKSAGQLGSKALTLVKTNVVLGMALNVITTWITDWYRKEFGYNNSIFVYPLWKADKPFAAGITGYRYIIPGYIEPEWMPLDVIQQIDTSNPTGVPKPATTPAKKDPNSLMGNVPAGSVIPPVETMLITSPMAMRNGKQHKGIDIAPLEPSKFTTKVRSIADGKVTAHGKNNASMGNWVEIQYTIAGKDYHTRYMHLYTLNIMEDLEISAGDVIGIMGNTGNVYHSKPGDIDEAGKARGEGTHLHFEIYSGTTLDADNLIDPEVFFKDLNIDTKRV